MTDTIAVADTPWYGVATTVEGLMTAEEAIEAGGLDWEVALRKTYFEGPNGGEPRLNPARFTTVRTDHEQALGVMGSDYQVLQNRDAFAFTTPLATMGAAYDSVGSLKNGQQIFLTMRLERVAFEEDPHDVYLFLRTSHDGTKSIQAIVTPICRRCTNQDSLITHTAQNRWTIRHLGTMQAKLAEAQESLKKTFKYVDSFEETARRLLAIDVEVDEFRKALEEVLPTTKRREKIVNQVLDVRETSKLILPEARQTAYGALMAWTEYTDHRRPFRSPQTRLVAVMDGWAAQFRNDLARKMLAR